MRYHFHVLLGAAHAADLEGEEFATFLGAKEEAIQNGRDVIADLLRHGRIVSRDFRVEIADVDGRVLETLPAALIVFGGAPTT